jgi:hypothetical protein
VNYWQGLGRNRKDGYDTINKLSFIKQRKRAKNYEQVSINPCSIV